MMEAEFEPEGYAYEDYDAAENEEFYATYDDGVCTICMGGSFVRRIYIGYESEGDYEEDYDLCYVFYVLSIFIFLAFAYLYKNIPLIYYK